MSQSTAVTADHLRRLACLYVRQSSLQQVRDHPESTARQYALKRRALALGWAADRIVVIDDDLGISGASAAERTGFQRVVADVGLGRVGVVMGLEVSRLARNSSDWHRLLEICALSETLILDEDGLYDPAHFNDRLLLGLKGTMSEAELHVLRARLIGGQLNKARRGELWIRPPLGFVVDPAGKLILDPDEQVQSAVRLVFGTFGRTGSAGAVVRYFQQQQVAWPQRVIKGLRAGVLVFGELERHRVLDILHNPRYAGAYVYGRTRQRKVCLTGQARYRRLPRDEWRVFLPDAHAGYLLEKIRARMESAEYPIFVTAGNGRQKLTHIMHNQYLAYCYGSLCTVEGSLVTFGFNFGEYDEHIIDAINRAARQKPPGKLWSVYIGVYSEEDRQHIERIEHKFRCKVHIYDTRTVQVWG